MMTDKMKETFYRAKKDKEFLAAIKSADNDNSPSMFACEVEKCVFAAIYYGYMVAKQGDNWREHYD